jgi:hypothetical protein
MVPHQLDADNRLIAGAVTWKWFFRVMSITCGVVVSHIGVRKLELIPGCGRCPTPTGCRTAIDQSQILLACSRPSGRFARHVLPGSLQSRPHRRPK